MTVAKPLPTAGMGWPVPLMRRKRLKRLKQLKPLTNPLALKAVAAVRVSQVQPAE
jgi:hypothetical protein